MKVAVIGSRSFIDKDLLYKTLDQVENKSLIVSGGTAGTDRLGEKYALDKSIPVKIFKPDWNTFGIRAGFIRNELIIKEAELVIAFWDGKSKGTKHSLDLAKKYNKQVMTVLFKEKKMEISI